MVNEIEKERLKSDIENRPLHVIPLKKKLKNEKKIHELLKSSGLPLQYKKCFGTEHLFLFSFL